MTDTNETRYVDPATWWDRLYTEAESVATGQGHAGDDVPVVLAKAEPDDQAAPEADDEDQADDKSPFDLRALADQLTGVLSETAGEREERRRRELEAKLAAAGETPAQRRERHREDRRQRERRTSMLLRVGQTERVRRFRRWVVLTGLSASAGYSLHVVQAATRLPPTVAGAALGGSWLLDLWMRRWGKVRVSQVRGLFPLALLIIIRMPFASVLVALLGLAPLLALTGHHH